jgi:predicted GNAT family N-acyltransferase
MDLRVVTTAAELAAALLVRKRVFVEEQGVSLELELDEHDVLGGDTTHTIALLDERVVGAGRLRPLGSQLAKLERIAVLSEHRGKGVGIALTQHLEDVATRRGFTQLTMNAQQSAVGFYEKLGYIAVGSEFLEADIPHQRMERRIA